MARRLPRAIARGCFHRTAVDDDVAFGILDRDRNVGPNVGVLTREALGTT